MDTIVTLTVNPTIDKSVSVPNVVPERKLRCSQPRHEPGGGGLNVSRAIRRLGGDSLAYYTRGGPLGQMLEGLLRQENINQCPIPIAGMTRENFIILEETTGLQYRFGVPGPVLTEPEWQRCLEEVASLHPAPTYLVASGSLPPGVPEDLYARLAFLAKERGIQLIVDSYGSALRQAAEAGVYLLKPNLSELTELAGCKLEEECDQEEFAEELVRSGRAKIVVVSLGAAGALLVSDRGSYRVRTPTVPIVSKIGAGDSMVAGMVLSLSRGWSLTEAVRFGVAAGAAAVMTPGTELCRREDAERLFERTAVVEPATI